MSLLCLAVGAAVQASSPTPACVQTATWRPVATDADRQRLRDARDAWTEALAQVGKAAGADPLFDPDRALDKPLPAAGAYRCRLVEVGGKGGVVMRDWGRCEVGADSLVKLDGPQRPTGRLYADTETRAIFLGTLLLGDETRPVGYGRDGMRDLVGVVERIDAVRWRVALPQRSFGSALDLIELVPA